MTSTTMSHEYRYISSQTSDVMDGSLLAQSFFAVASSGSLGQWDATAPPILGNVTATPPVKKREERVQAIELKGSEFEMRIAKYEKIIGMSADELLEKEKTGDAPDSFEAKYLSALTRMR